MADLSLDETQEIIIRDSTTSSNELKVNTDGSINVQATIGALTPVPPGAIAITKDEFGDVSDTNGVDTYYTITNGKTLTIQRFTGGSEGSTFGSVSELFYDPNGNLTNTVRIETIFSNGTTYQVGINASYVGNGTRRIVLRRRSYSSNAREIWGRWEGYEV